MLRLSELPVWLRRSVAVAYLVWVLVVTGFAAYVVVRSLGFECVSQPTTATIVLIGGLLVAPLFPFAQRLLFPGGGGVEFDVGKAREASRAAEEGIRGAAVGVELPPLDLDLREEGE